MSQSFETESHKSPEELEQEIDAKRASISNIVDQLESRFTPGQLIDQALAYTKGNGGEFLSNLGTTLKNNPVPTTLTGLGLAWLAMNQNKPFNPGSPSSMPGFGDKLSQAASQVKGAVMHASDRLHDATDSAMATGRGLKDKASGFTHGTASSFSSTSGQLSDTAHQTADRLGAQTQQLKSQLDHVLKEQPLVLAAIGMALGAVIGAALPSTRKEDQLFGETRDQAVSMAKSKGQEAYTKAKDVAADAVGSTGKQDEQRDSTTQASAGTDLSEGLGTQR